MLQNLKIDDETCEVWYAVRPYHEGQIVCRKFMPPEGMMDARTGKFFDPRTDWEGVEYSIEKEVCSCADFTREAYHWTEMKVPGVEATWIAFFDACDRSFGEGQWELALDWSSLSASLWFRNQSDDYKLKLMLPDL